MMRKETLISIDNEFKIKQINNAIRMLMDMTNMLRDKESNIHISYVDRFFKDVKHVISERNYG